jgi:type II secretory pathway component PulJ
MHGLRKGGDEKGFTLLEVVLAVTIAVGMMAVVLYFYSQAAQLRNQVIGETGRINAARMILERLTAELRTALPGSTSYSGLTGTSNELQFVRLEAPIVSPLTMDTNLSASLSPVTLKTVHYFFTAPEDETNKASLVRIEAPVNSEPVVAVTNEVEVLSETNAAPRGLELTRELNFVLFRYWNGSGWQDYWDNASLPLGVEVSLGIEPLPPELPPEEYPFELYRRTIFLPMGDRNIPAGTNAAPSDMGSDEDFSKQESEDF